jgi:hypothetical protein
MMDAAWAELMPRGARWHTSPVTEGSTSVTAHGAAGAPLWPEGIVGSITHAGGYRTVATASTEHIAALGIDMEPLAPVAAKVWPHFLHSEELDPLLALPAPQRGLAALSIWCLKEALFKALAGRVPFDALPLQRIGNTWRPAMALRDRMLGLGLNPSQLVLHAATAVGWQCAAAYQINNL